MGVSAGPALRSRWRGHARRLENEKSSTLRSHCPPSRDWAAAGRAPNPGASDARGHLPGPRAPLQCGARWAWQQQGLRPPLVRRVTASGWPWALTGGIGRKKIPKPTSAHHSDMRPCAEGCAEACSASPHPTGTDTSSVNILRHAPAAALIHRDVGRARRRCWGPGRPFPYVRESCFICGMGGGP